MSFAMNRLLLCVIAVLSAPFAQAEKLQSHPTERDGYVGLWRVIKIDNNRQPKPYQATPIFQADCQFFSYDADGRWDHLEIANMAGTDKTKEMCDGLTSKQVLEYKALSAPRSTYTWRATEVAGFFITERAAPKQNLLWKVDTVDRDFDGTQVQVLGIALKEHDLILQVWNVKDRQAAWGLLLRPVL